MKHLIFSLFFALYFITLPFVSAQALTGDDLIAGQSLQRLTEKREAFGLDENSYFSLQSVDRDPLGQRHVRMQQFYRGVRVWGGEVISHTDTSSKELSQTAAIKSNIQLDVKPTLSTADALSKVKADLAFRLDFANEPTIELVIYPETAKQVLPQRANKSATRLNAEDFATKIQGYQLAYYIHTEIENPGDTRHTDYLVNAHTGAIIEKWDSLYTSNAIGTGKSQYSGSVNLNTNSVTGGYELRDLTRPMQDANVVYDLSHATSGTGSLYTDADNVWGDGVNFKEDPEPTTSSNGQTAAVDAAFGLQTTWDMYKNVFGRNGINGLGASTYARVHYDNAYDNAFYSDRCQCITYGDGTKLQTLTSLDIAAHEFSHGVCSTTVGLIYNKESGGLNEANSDIMGAMAEFYAKGANSQGNIIPNNGGTWTQGEQVTTPAYPLKMRFLYKPSKDGKSADAWSPTLASLDVHYSSGPMNRCFYFLSQGATTTGDTSSTFLPQSMSGIGNDKAAKIWFRALTTYMTSATDYAAARIAMIQAVRDLFPLAGPEEVAVWNAFAAINVGSPWNGPDLPPTITVSESGTKGMLDFSATANDDKGVVKVEFHLDGTLIGVSTAAPYAMSYDSQMQDDGSHTLVAKAIDTSGQYTTATLDFTIANGQLIRNGSFEKGYGIGWSNTSGMQIGTILGQTAYDGTKMAKFCGTGSKMSVGLYQSVAIPDSATSASLSFALHIETKEPLSGGARDNFAVQIRNNSGSILQTLATYSNQNAASGYKVYSFDIAAYKGQTIQVYFLGAEDDSLSTGFVLDKVNLNVPGGDTGDNQKPVVSVSESGSNEMIGFSAAATDNVRVTKVEFFVDGKLKGTVTTLPYQMTLDSKTLSNGNHELTATAYDAAGNMGTSTPVSFSVNNAGDPEPPTASVSESGSSGTITINATATDNVGVVKVEFYVDGGLKGTDTAMPFSMPYDSMTLTNGPHNLMAKAYDAAGNIGTSNNVLFNIDNPSVSTTYNEVENNSNIGLANAVGDAVTKIVGFIGNSTDQDFFKVNVAAGHTLTINMTGPAKDYDLYLLNNKGYTLKASTNIGSSESISFKNTGSEAATYVIKVAAFGGAYTTTTPYDLALSR